ncbi:glutathione S-transferase [Kordiimonas sediminis]|uniref:Glutathione S-transferase n=1 Tax=Kordiimonas sediminis TaxID=1735581 RepID=A0A919E9T9_9PROT|nr:glutathione S-transferase family protein [Kordiimonas sediminis]GHF28005.1 glutathione S-transferase [Kordiimonas sediminis]
MIIYGDSISGNCLKVKYVCDLLAIPYSWQETSVLNAETRTAEMLAKNPAGQVPFIKLDDGRHLAQSNAIMVYLAKGSNLIPDDPYSEAKMNEWLFWEQYSHEPNIAVIRFQRLYKKIPPDKCDQDKIQKGYAALDYMEQHLGAHCWFVGDSLSLADIALYAYTQFAEDAGFNLLGYPHIRQWLNRVARDLCVE